MGWKRFKLGWGIGVGKDGVGFGGVQIRGWGRGGQRSWGVKVEAVGVGVGGVWVEGSSQDRVGRKQGWKPKPENPVLKEILGTQTETDTYLTKFLKT